MLAPLSRYASEWPQDLSPQEHYHWWFVDADPTEMARLFARAHENRMKAAEELAHSKTASHIFCDRGPASVSAMCIAYFAHRNKVPIASSVESLHKLEILPLRSVRIPSSSFILLPDSDPSHYLSRCLSAANEREESNLFSEEQRLKYAQYHQTLFEALAFGAQDQTSIHIDGNRSIVQIQNAIRDTLREPRYGNPIDPLWPHLTQIVGLAGPSESGKSTAGDFIHYTSGGGRFKLNYFLELARLNMGWKFNPDSQNYLDGVSDDALCEAMLDAIDRFCMSHYYLPNISLESFHGFGLARAMKSYLGNQFNLLYVDADKDLRLSRAKQEASLSHVSHDIFYTKEETKFSRGLLNISAIADHHIDNSATYYHFKRKLSRAIYPPVRYEPNVVTIEERLNEDPFVSVASKLLSLLRQSLGDRLRMVAFLGSIMNGSPIPGWSDIDALVVIDGHPQALLEATHSAAKATDIKLGLSYYSVEDFESGVFLDSKAWASVRYVLSGNHPVQVFAGCGFPDPQRPGTATELDRALIEVLSQLKRALIEPDDRVSTRRLYKLIHLCAQMFGRCEESGLGHTIVNPTATRSWVSRISSPIPNAEEVIQGLISLRALREIGARLVAELF